MAFVHARGVHLIEKELRSLGDSTRLLVTTTFDATGGTALSVASSLGTQVRVLNPGSGSTYHPKVYLGRRRNSARAIVGSANLTGGLATNVEAAVLLDGSMNDRPIASLWEWAQERWQDSRSETWRSPLNEGAADDVLAIDLLARIEDARREDPVFRTLGPSAKANRMTDLSADGALIETARSREHTGGASFVPAWMFNMAWDYLVSRGQLTNSVLLRELRVHRSSAVLAVLARLRGVAAMTGNTVGVRLRP